MEEVDEIVLHTLRQIGCDLGEIISLKEFNTEIAIESVVRCLKLINPSLDLPRHVPQNMSARYRLGSTLASICSELGYKGEIGYQTFLYSNESDLRKIYLFLFENLPKESEKALEEPLDKITLILKETGLSLTRSLCEPWLPNYCKLQTSSKSKILLGIPRFSLVNFKSVPLFNGTNCIHRKSKSSTAYLQKCLPLLPAQVSPYSLLEPSVLETNALDFLKQCSSELDEEDLTSVLNKKDVLSRKKDAVTKVINEHLIKAVQRIESIPEKLKVSSNEKQLEVQGSRFTHTLQLQFTPEKKAQNISVPQKSESEENVQQKREAEIKELQENVDTLTNKLETLLTENKSYDTSSQNVSELIRKEQVKVDELSELYRVKKCTLSLLPQAESNIGKLQGLIDASSQKLVALANQWELHRVPLIEQYRDLRELSSRRVNETQRKLEEIKLMREKIRKLGVEARQKEEVHKHIVSAYEKLTKDVNRSAYTRRIMEIVANIKKQKAEIDKVLLDTRNVQKEINKLSGKLERTFVVTDELVFKDAKKDEASRRAYKYLASLHENCSGLIMIVEETGTIMREIRELEDQIEQENQKKVSDTLERITSDYKQMLRENATLLAQIK